MIRKQKMYIEKDNTKIHKIVMTKITNHFFDNYFEYGRLICKKIGPYAQVCNAMRNKMIETIRKDEDLLDIYKNF